MRGIWQILRKDVKRATSNVVAVIVIVGLTVLPSLFTWFNVLASWDPFGNTKNLSVAVANTDQGYKSDLVPMKINIGDQVLSVLRANRDLNWVVTTEADAVDGTRSGAYYAAIVMPPDFSRNMMTFYADDATRTSITYYTNEKKNALAPKITGQGADEVSVRINESFTETLSDVALNIVTSLSDSMDRSDSRAVLARLESHVGQAEIQLRDASRTAAMFTTLLNSSESLVRSSARLAGDSAQSLRDTGQAVEGSVGAARSVKDTLDTSAASLSGAVDQSAQGYREAGDRIDDVYAAVNVSATDRAEAIESVQQRVQTQIDEYQNLKRTLDEEVRGQLPEDHRPDLDAVDEALDTAIAHQVAVRDRLHEAADNVRAADRQVQADRQEIADLIDEATRSIEQLRDQYQNTLKPDLEELSTTLDSAAATLSSIDRDLSAAGDDLSGSSESVIDRLAAAKDATVAMSRSLEEAADKLADTEDALSKAADSGDLSALRQAIGSDPDALAASLAHPVGVRTVAVFPVANFGSAMAPLYTTLALWVGALLMSVAISVEVPDDWVPGRTGLKPYQKYLGRYGIFVLVGFLQSTLVCLGNVLFIGVQAVHPMLFVLTGWLAGLVFTLIVYTCVVTFGSAGKALMVLLLVMQISGAGGSYPLQMLPQWFQNISPFLPATHAITAFRGAIAGIYGHDYWIALGYLALFIPPMLLLGLVLRKPLISINERFVQAAESTKLM